MDFLTSIYNAILGFIKSILEFFGLDTSKVPGFVGGEEDTTAAQ